MALDHNEEYQKVRPLYESLGSRVSSLLQDIAIQKRIEIHAIEYRAKTLESFREKISRPGKQYEDPLKEITDLCGVRVILYYQEDVDLFSAIIKEEFSVDHKHSVDKKNELRYDQFGYMSIHLVCEVSSRRSELIEWMPYSGLKLEVQVRTVLQHAWASISHALKYKSETETPDQLARQLTRIAGLLELSDEQFSELRKKTKSLQSTIAKKIDRNNLEVAIDNISLQHFLEKSKTAISITDAAKEHGFVAHKSSSSRQLAFVCHALGISSLSELDSKLSRFLSRASNYFSALAENQSELGLSADSTFGDTDHWCAVALIAAMHGTKESQSFAEKDFWSGSYVSSVLSAAVKANI